MPGKTSLTALLEDDEKRTANRGGDNPFLKIERPAKERDYFRIRILPPFDDSGIPFFERKLQYFNTPNGLTVTSSPKGDPAEKLYWKTRSKFSQAGGALQRTWSNLAPTTKYYWNVVVRDTGEVKILATTYKVWNLILDEIRNYLRDDVDITDPETGRDVTLTIEQAINFGKPGMRITGVSVAPKEEPVGVEDWEEKLHNLKEATEPSNNLSVEEIEELLPTILGDHYETITGKTMREPGED